MKKIGIALMAAALSMPFAFAATQSTSQTPVAKTATKKPAKATSKAKHAKKRTSAKSTAAKPSATK